MSMSWGNSFIQFDNLTKDTEKQLKKDVQDIVTGTGAYLKKTAKSLTPVDTGLLRRSWTRKSSGRGFKRKVVVENLVPYGGYVEFGTIKMAPRRMLSKAVLRSNRYMVVKMGKLKMKMASKFNQG